MMRVFFSKKKKKDVPRKSKKKTPRGFKIGYIFGMGNDCLLNFKCTSSSVLPLFVPVFRFNLLRAIVCPRNFSPICLTQAMW